MRVVTVIVHDEARLERSVANISRNRGVYCKMRLGLEV